jgi:diaminohydroxyphosphoribosylaminopyrimidine deaminase/5-amino-6-(5-phosphoribosylamino)uracil reductase
VRDDDAMARAVALAATARRHTAPWPAVGAVIVRDGEVVGEGATGRFPTGPHAEVAALRAAGSRAQGATAYVTLEPCDHHGNTPPCTGALIDAGIARVVIALEDPDLRVSGRGIERLRAAGIEVATDVGGADAAHSLAAYLHHRRTGRPLVVAKTAQSLDARVTAADGGSRWITSEVARADAHELRADSQAIVVGAGTALVDQPALTVRGVDDRPARPPVRVVLDARGRVPAHGPLFDMSLAPTLVVTTAGASHEAVDAWIHAGAKVETVPSADSAGDRGVDLDATFRLLGAEGVLQALVEGGPTLIGACLTGRHVQRLVMYVAPLVLGTRGRAAFELTGPSTLAGARPYELVASRVTGPDVRLDYEVA